MRKTINANRVSTCTRIKQQTITMWPEGWLAFTIRRRCGAFVVVYTILSFILLWAPVLYTDVNVDSQHNNVLGNYMHVNLDLQHANWSSDSTGVNLKTSGDSSGVTLKTDTLLVISTCNHVEHTLKFIRSLMAGTNQFDLLVVDDHSVDGTPEILRRMGVRVVAKDAALGLTHSWNLAYGIFKKQHLLGQYTYMVIANNDLLIGNGGIDMLRKALAQHRFVVPMSTTLGVGHNPPQSIDFVHNLSKENTSYVNAPGNHARVQAGLTARAAKVGLSFTPTPKKFNGFLFAFRAPDIFAAEYAPNVLFDVESIMVGQEDTLVKRLSQQNITPMISHDVFVFHFKSVTVRTAGFEMGSKNETREDLIHYHPELKESHSGDSFTMQPAEEVLHSGVPSHSALGSRDSVVLAFAISDPITNSAAGDIMTALEFGDSISSVLGWTIKYLGEPDWYKLEGVDILITLLDKYDVTKIVNDKAALVKIAWPRNWFDRWVKMRGIGQYDLILSSSQKGKEFVDGEQPFMNMSSAVNETWVPVEVLRIATNSIKFSKSQAAKEFNSDYTFTGSYWGAHRNIMDFEPNNVPFTGAVYGKNWDAAPVTDSFKAINRGMINYSSMGSVYKSAKVVIDDANHVTGPWGSVNSRVYDSLAAGTLVITNGVIGANETFGDLLPIFSSAMELEVELTKYLSNSSKRTELATELKKIVHKHHSYTTRAHQLHAVIDKHSLLPFNATCRICVIVRTHPGQSKILPNLLMSLTQQHYSSNAISVQVLVANTDPFRYNDTQFMVDAATHANDAAGYEVVTLRKDHIVPPSPLAYGYDVTDTMIDELLETSNCSHILITNGDNVYNSGWLKHIAGEIKAGKQMIAWDFTSHHNRASNVISVKIARKFVDLGAVLLDRRAIEHTGARFVAEGIFTNDWFARDWWFFKTIYDFVGEKGVGIVHQVLFMHQ